MSSSREKREDKKNLNDQHSKPSEILNEKFKIYRDHQRGSQSPVTATFSAHAE